MTVQATTPTAEQQFSDLFRSHLQKITSFLWRRLDLHQRTVAEDLASETMTELWVKYYGRGVIPDNPPALAYVIARSTLSGYLRDQKPRESVAVDFTDPVNTPMVATGSTYGPDMPEAAGLASELDVALEQMTIASKNWRTSHKDAHSLRRRLDDDFVVGYNQPITPQVKEATRQRLVAVELQQQDNLRTFQAACARVGSLRAQIEAVAGPNWKSPISLPAVQQRASGTQAYTYRRDFTITHCQNGHELTVDNVNFFEDGTRSCRPCMHKLHRQRVESRRDGAVETRAIPEEAVANARAMLADPAYAHLSLSRIGEMVGMPATSMYKRIPDMAALRREGAKVGAAHQAKLEKARALLADSQCTYSIERIAREAGVTSSTVRLNFPAEVAAHVARQRQTKEQKTRIVSALLRDP
ncbi:RNA polymerase sigma factor, partial [Streptomyces eurythermus]